jgi:P-type Cu+ transporter
MKPDPETVANPQYSSAKAAHKRGTPTAKRLKTTARDPVCGMAVDPRQAASHAHAGKTFYFCSKACRDRFGQTPDAYLNRADRPASAVPGGTYTCPMHPEVVRDQPEICPICGMALEPRTVLTQPVRNQELISMTRRFWASLALTIPLLVLTMGDMVPGVDIGAWLGARISDWLQLLLATPVVLWGGRPFFVRAWRSVVHRSLNMFTLIALGVGAAYLASLAALLFPEWLPATFRGHGDQLCFTSSLRR